MRRTVNYLLTLGLLASLAVAATMAVDGDQPSTVNANASANTAKAGEDKKPVDVSSTNTTKLGMSSNEKELTFDDFIFPLVCGLAAIPLFAFVIAAALYQPFYTKRRAEKKQFEDRLEQKKRSDSATEKYLLLQKQISITHAPRDRDRKSGSSNV